MGLYTKNGNPLQLRGDDLYDKAGRYVGRRQGNKIYGSNGRYQGTVVGDRVIYRSTDSAGIASSTVSRASIAGSAEASRIGASEWGDEPTWDK